MAMMSRPRTATAPRSITFQPASIVTTTPLSKRRSACSIMVALLIVDVILIVYHHFVVALCQPVSLSGLMQSGSARDEVPRNLLLVGQVGGSAAHLPDKETYFGGLWP